jgi:hypothetical protein
MPGHILIQTLRSAPPARWTGRVRLYLWSDWYWESRTFSTPPTWSPSTALLSTVVTGLHPPLGRRGFGHVAHGGGALCGQDRDR